MKKLERLLGAKTFGLLRSLIAPEKPGEKNDKDIVDALRGHFSLKAACNCRKM